MGMGEAKYKDVETEKDEGTHNGKLCANIEKRIFDPSQSGFVNYHPFAREKGKKKGGLESLSEKFTNKTPSHSFPLFSYHHPPNSSPLFSSPERQRCHCDTDTLQGAPRAITLRPPSLSPFPSLSLSRHFALLRAVNLCVTYRRIFFLHASVVARSE